MTREGERSQSLHLSTKLLKFKKWPSLLRLIVIRFCNENMLVKVNPAKEAFLTIVVTSIYYRGLRELVDEGLQPPDYTS